MKGILNKIAIGADPNAFSLKNVLIEHIKSLDYEVYDYSADDPIYANIAIALAEAVVRGEHPSGILICGTGIGMSIAANKVPGAYAALCSDAYSTERARLSNNANIMTLGAQVIGPELAKSLVTIWLGNQYVPGGRSEPKIQRICQYEETRNQ